MRFDKQAYFQPPVRCRPGGQPRGRCYPDVPMFFQATGFTIAGPTQVIEDALSCSAPVSAGMATIALEVAKRSGAPARITAQAQSLLDVVRGSKEADRVRQHAQQAYELLARWADSVGDRAAFDRAIVEAGPLLAKERTTSGPPSPLVELNRILAVQGVPAETERTPNGLLVRLVPGAPTQNLPQQVRGLPVTYQWLSGR